MELWIQSKECQDYEVSSEGRIRNIKTGRIMKTNINTRGYRQVCLRENKKQVVKRVHRLVADAFYDGCHNGLDVNHIDGDKLNNKVSNLEWCTRKENIQHAFKSGLSKSNLNNNLRQKGNERMKEIVGKAVRVIETNKVYPSLNECARQTGCNPSDIAKCCKGYFNQHHGLHFEFI